MRDDSHAPSVAYALPTKTRGLRAALAVAEPWFLLGMLAGDLLLLLGSVATCALLPQLTVTLERTSGGVQ